MRPKGLQKKLLERHKPWKPRQEIVDPKPAELEPICLATTHGHHDHRATHPKFCLGDLQHAVAAPPREKRLQHQELGPPSLQAGHAIDASVDQHRLMTQPLNRRLVDPLPKPGCTGDQDLRAVPLCTHFLFP